jgi:metal-sulfur cluster biosynthetic enzyme
MSDITEAVVQEALKDVIDPELGYNIVDLGLVYGITIDGTAVDVVMTMTTPGCPVSESLPEEARAAVRRATADRLPVDVRVVWDPPWDPSMMDEGAASAPGFRM